MGINLAPPSFCSRTRTSRKLKLPGGGDVADMLPINFERHDCLYLPDGNICLTSALVSDESNSDSSAPGNFELERRLVFRVHKSVLAIHSPVFSDMLALSADSSDAGSIDAEYDGAPLVFMHDTTRDLEVLLMALYHGL